MSDYTRGTNFTAKDSLVTGNPSKLVKGSEIDAELNAIASAIATKLNTSTAASTYAPLASPALTGTPTAPTPATSDNSTKIATTEYVNNVAMNAALPSQTGNSGKYLSSDGTNASWTTLTPPKIVRVARTSNTILDATNNQNEIDITSGTFTQTVTAAATLGSGWYCYFKNSGTGTVTIDPNGSETIGGAATLAVTSGMSIIIQCDGSNFNVISLSGIGEHEVVLHSGNGHGSVNNKIRRFTTTQTNVGTAITYSDSATLGASFTINEAGLYAVHYMDLWGGGGDWLGVSLNSSQPTIAINSITVANRIMMGYGPAGGQPAVLARVVRLSSGDVVRAHTGGNADATTDKCFFAIRKVGL